MLSQVLPAPFHPHHHHGSHKSHAAEHFGWTAVPRSIDKFLKDADKENSAPHACDSFPLPTSTIAVKMREYAKANLPEVTFNHCMRVFYFGSALLNDHRPSGLEPTASLVETFFLSCLLHDIGTVPSVLRSTRLSFELWGAFKAMQLLPAMGASPDQTELVAEVVSRHQDIGEVGSVPAVLGLLYYGTLLDNIGLQADYVHRSTIDHVVKVWPRLNWTSCFVATVRDEMMEKPWSHSTVIDKFAERIEGNKLMNAYE